jgi:hypothetical protein
MSYELLAVTHINSMFDELADVRTIAGDFRWTGTTDGKLKNVTASNAPRIPWHPRYWGEIAARISDRPTIAPIIGYGQRAPLKTPNLAVRLEQNDIPKIKHGVQINEDMLIMLHRIEENLSRGLTESTAVMEDISAFNSYEVGQLEMLDLGCRYRIEHMAIGMLCNTYAYGTEHGQAFNMSWGMPADLNVTVSTQWGDGNSGSTHANVGATPITDMQLLQTLAEQEYGTTFNRASMPLYVLNYIFFTTEFKNLAPIYATRMGISPAAPTLPFNDYKYMKSILEAMWELKIEIDDRKFMYEDPALDNWNAPPNVPASGQYLRLHPSNKVILTNDMDDGSLNTWEISNAPVLEAKAGMVPNMIGTPDSGKSVFGPFSYVTSADSNGNPPGLNLWSTMSAVPRKKKLASSAVLTVCPLVQL